MGLSWGVPSVLGTQDGIIPGCPQNMQQAHRNRNVHVNEKHPASTTGTCTCDSTYGVILRIVRAGCHPVAIAQVVEH